ncbi:MAG: Rieske (2Fe-2S) protein [Chitinophagaceae bacterium]
MERKEFIKTTCNICLLGAAGILLPQLIGCSPGASVYKTAIANNKLEVPANLFDKAALQLVRPQGWYYDIAVQKNENNTYSALLLKCTHQDNQLTMSGNGYQCSLHGSQFDKAGKVKKGPAEIPLKSYETTIIDNRIIINL